MDEKPKSVNTSQTGFAQSSPTDCKTYLQLDALSNQPTDSIQNNKMYIDSVQHSNKNGGNVQQILKTNMPDKNYNDKTRQKQLETMML